MPEKPLHKIPIGFLLLIATLPVLLIYSPTRHFDFAWDDKNLFVQSDAYTSTTAFHDAWLKPFSINSDFYRPLAESSFALENLLHGLNPGYMHTTGLAIHGMNAFLCGLLVWTLLATRPFARRFAIASTLAYGLHYGLMELPAWVSCRFDLLCTFGLLLTLSADALIKSRWAAGAAASLAFLIAATSKESAIVLAAVLPCWHIALSLMQNNSPKNHLIRQWPVYFLLAITGMLFAAGHHWVTYPEPVAANLTEGIAQYASQLPPHTIEWLPLKTLDLYLRLIFIPFAYVSPIYTDALPHWPVFLAGIIGLCALGCLTAIKKPEGKAAVFLLIAGAISLLPVLNFIPIHQLGSIAATRYIAFPTSLFVIACALLVHTQIHRLKILSFAFGGWLFFNTLSILTALPMWENDATLWTWASYKNPQSAYAASNMVSSKYGQISETEFNALLLSTWKKFPDEGNLTIYVAAYQNSIGQHQEAINTLALLNGKNLLPAQADRYMDIAIVSHFNLCRPAQHFMPLAIEATKITPDSAQVWNRLILAAQIAQDAEIKAEALQRLETISTTEDRALLESQREQQLRVLRARCTEYQDKP